MKKELANATLSLGGLIISSYLLTASFKPSVRRVLKKRAEDCSQLSGRDDRPLEAAHLNHCRTSGFYNKPSNGLLVTDIEHLAHHLFFRQNPELIGLSIKDNNRAIKALFDRVRSYDRKNHIFLSKDSFHEELEVATESWKFFLYEFEQ